MSVNQSGCLEWGFSVGRVKFAPGELGGKRSMRKESLRCCHSYEASYVAEADHGGTGRIVSGDFHLNFAISGLYPKLYGSEPRIMEEVPFSTLNQIK